MEGISYGIIKKIGEKDDGKKMINTNNLTPKSQVTNLPLTPASTFNETGIQQGINKNIKKDDGLLSFLNLKEFNRF